MTEGVITRTEFINRELIGKFLFIFREKPCTDYRGKIKEFQLGKDLLIFNCSDFSSRSRGSAAWEEIGGNKSFLIRISPQAIFFQIAPEMIIIYPRNELETEILIIRP